MTIARSDIDRYFDNAFSEMMPTANVPGFRSGRAPRKVVENRFRQEVSDQIKGSLLMDSLAQISEEQEFSAISEPELDLEAVEVPKQGPNAAGLIPDRNDNGGLSCINLTKLNILPDGSSPSNPIDEQQKRVGK